MDEIGWLISLAGSHIKLIEKLSREKTEAVDDTFDFSHIESDTPDIDKDRAALEEIFTDCSDIPERLKGLSYSAVLCLARFVELNTTGKSRITGHEIISLIKIEEHNYPIYLQALDELEQSKLLRFTPDEKVSIPFRPYGWLQCWIEMGEGFAADSHLNELSVAAGYSSNEEYLDEVMKYLNQLSKRLKDNKQSLCNDDVHFLPEWRADSKYHDIELKLANTTIPISAASIRTSLNMSEWQYLFLIGIVGNTEQVIDYDFSDVNDVVKLFASSYTLRTLMREHLVGKESPLVKLKLFESSEGTFFTSSKPTPKALRLISGKKPSVKTVSDIIEYAAKETLFEVDRPKIKSDSLMLPAQVMETVETILYCEKSGGKAARAELHKKLPSSFGTPVGTTILLYGASGTGKSLTASYLASELKVPILKVDCAKILDRYIGESEKNVKKIFSDYAAVSGMLHKSPVLLLNEADQLLGSRVAVREYGDQMNNNIQNLFLEGLERFEGILVATTNRRDLLDSAYSRRFTYKLELPEPDTALRKKLWLSHIPEKICDDSIDLDQLAGLDLTGGEIRLVLEQAVRTLAYRGGKKLEGSMLYEIAKKEVIASGKQATKQRIGFGCIFRMNPTMIPA